MRPHLAGLGLTNSLHASTVALVLVPVFVRDKRLGTLGEEEEEGGEEEGLFKANAVN